MVNQIKKRINIITLINLFQKVDKNTYFLMIITFYLNYKNIYNLLKNL